MHLLRRYVLLLPLLVWLPMQWTQALRPWLGWRELAEALALHRKAPRGGDLRVLAHVERASQLLPDSSYPDWFRGLFALCTPGSAEEAEAPLRRFARSREDDVALMLRLAEMARRSKTWPLSDVDLSNRPLSAHTACILAGAALHFGEVEEAADLLSRARLYGGKSLLYEHMAGLVAAVQGRKQASLAHLEQASVLRFSKKRLPNLGLAMTTAHFRLLEREDESLRLEPGPWIGEIIPLSKARERDHVELLYNLVVLYRQCQRYWKSMFMAQILEKTFPQTLKEIGLEEPLRRYLHPRNHRALVEGEARKNGIDPCLVYAVMREESHFNPKVVSKAGAIGLMQLMPETARRLALETGERHFQADWLRQPARNIELGSRYLARLLKEFSDAPDPVPWVLVAYNAGPRRSRRWLNRWKANGRKGSIVQAVRLRETRGYVEKVGDSLAEYHRLYRDAPSDAKAR